jgi:esterase/lipase superfamily enzyme
VLFATNRRSAQVPPGAMPDFTDETLPATPGSLFCAAAQVAGIDIANPASGTIVQIDEPASGGFSEQMLAPLLASQHDVLVFVHGAANSFTDAITRAAYNKEWLGAASVAEVSAVCDIIAFTWPARSYVIANIVGDYVDYLHDQTEAAASAYHFGLFLAQIVALRRRLGRRRVNLLCHSMGNYMLAGAVELLYRTAAAPAVPLFDEIVLAAADEVATTFTTPSAGRLANLWRLGREITVYFANDDIAMALSHVVNQDFRLGYDGPPNEADTAFFSPSVYEFVDCTNCSDYISTLLDEPDRSHEYYRQSPTVRADILATLGGGTPKRLGYSAAANRYTLFPPAAVVTQVQTPPGGSG